jgi:hypothetical protein
MKITIKSAILFLLQILLWQLMKKVMMSWTCNVAKETRNQYRSLVGKLLGKPNRKTWDSPKNVQGK